MKLLFHHIPKTAGTTLIGFLDQQFDTSQILPSNYFKKPARDVLKKEIIQKKKDLLKYEFIRAHFPANGFNKSFEDYYRVTILRNPTKRLFSLFNDWRTKSEESLKNAHLDDIKCASIARSFNISDFLKHITHPIQALFDNGQVRILSGSMTKETLDASDLKKAKETLDSINLVGTTEMLDVCIMLISQNFDWNYPEQIQSLNTRKYDQSEINFADKDIIYNHVKWDNELYSYAQQLLKKSIVEYFDQIKSSNKLEKTHTKSEIEINMLQGFKSTGFHVREGLDTDMVWRWTGPSTKSTVAVNLSLHIDYLLKIDIISVIEQKIIDNIVLEINDTPIEVKHNGIINNQQQIEARIDRDHINEYAEDLIIIKVPFTISHAESQPETLDHRQKGIAITKIEIKPI